MREGGRGRDKGEKIHVVYIRCILPRSQDLMQSLVCTLRGDHLHHVENWTEGSAPSDADPYHVVLPLHKSH